MNKSELAVTLPKFKANIQEYLTFLESRKKKELIRSSSDINKQHLLFQEDLIKYYDKVKQKKKSIKIGKKNIENLNDDIRNKENEDKKFYETFKTNLQKERLTLSEYKRMTDMAMVESRRRKVEYFQLIDRTAYMMKLHSENKEEIKFIIECIEDIEKLLNKLRDKITEVAKLISDLLKKRSCKILEKQDKVKIVNDDSPVRNESQEEKEILIQTPESLNKSDKDGKKDKTGKKGNVVSEMKKKKEQKNEKTQMKTNVKKNKPKVRKKQLDKMKNKRKKLHPKKNKDKAKGSNLKPPVDDSKESGFVESEAPIEQKDTTNVSGGGGCCGKKSTQVVSQTVEMVELQPDLPAETTKKKKVLKKRKIHKKNMIKKKAFKSSKPKRNKIKAKKPNNVKGSNAKLIKQDLRKEKDKAKEKKTDQQDKDINKNITNQPLVKLDEEKTNNITDDNRAKEINIKEAENTPNKVNIDEKGESKLITVSTVTQEPLKKIKEKPIKLISVKELENRKKEYEEMYKNIFEYYEKTSAKEEKEEMVVPTDDKINATPEKVNIEEPAEKQNPLKELREKKMKLLTQKEEDRKILKAREIDEINALENKRLQNKPENIECQMYHLDTRLDKIKKIPIFDKKKSKKLKELKISPALDYNYAQLLMQELIEKPVEEEIEEESSKDYEHPDIFYDELIGQLELVESRDSDAYPIRNTDHYYQFDICQDEEEEDDDADVEKESAEHKSNETVSKSTRISEMKDKEGLIKSDQKNDQSTDLLKVNIEGENVVINEEKLSKDKTAGSFENNQELLKRNQSPEVVADSGCLCRKTEVKTQRLSDTDHKGQIILHPVLSRSIESAESLIENEVHHDDKIFDHEEMVNEEDSTSEEEESVTEETVQEGEGKKVVDIMPKSKLTEEELNNQKNWRKLKFYSEPGQNHISTLICIVRARVDYIESKDSFVCDFIEPNEHLPEIDKRENFASYIFRIYPSESQQNKTQNELHLAIPFTLSDNSKNPMILCCPNEPTYWVEIPGTVMQFEDEAKRSFVECKLPNPKGIFCVISSPKKNYTTLNKEGMHVVCSSDNTVTFNVPPEAVRIPIKTILQAYKIEREMWDEIIQKYERSDSGKVVTASTVLEIDAKRKKLTQPGTVTFYLPEPNFAEPPREKKLKRVETTSTEETEAVVVEKKELNTFQKSLTMPSLSVTEFSNVHFLNFNKEEEKWNNNKDANMKFDKNKTSIITEFPFIQSTKYMLLRTKRGTNDETTAKAAIEINQEFCMRNCYIALFQSTKDVTDFKVLLSQKRLFSAHSQQLVEEGYVQDTNNHLVSVVLSERQLVNFKFTGNLYNLLKLQQSSFTFYSLFPNIVQVRTRVKNRHGQKALNSFRGYVELYIKTLSKPKQTGNKPAALTKMKVLVARLLMSIPKFKLPHTRRLRGSRFIYPQFTKCIRLMKIVANAIGHQWYEFGTKLGIPNNRLQFLKVQYCDKKPVKRAEQMLTYWLKGCSSQENKREELRKALIALGRYDVLEKLYTKERVIFGC